jgi:peptidylglycine monooxygenase
MHPFAFRTHAHKLAIVNSGYVIKNDENGEENWTEIGKRSPQLPQMFYPVKNDIEVRKGDILAARCTMFNFKERTVSIG